MDSFFEKSIYNEEFKNTEFKEFNTELFESTITIISLLIRQYKANLININDFRKHTFIKINFVLKNLKFVEDANIKSNIKCLVNECIAINNTYSNS